MWGERMTNLSFFLHSLALSVAFVGFDFWVERENFGCVCLSSPFENLVLKVVTT